MIQIPRRYLAAIEAVLDIAYHGGAQPVRGAEIADRLGVPRRYLEQSLQSLVRQGVLVAQRGPRGGYRLARERRRISVGDIVRAVGGNGDGEDAVASGTARRDGPSGAAASAAAGTGGEVTSVLGRAVVIPMAEVAEQVLQAHLDQVTVDDLCRQGRASGVPGARDDALDFSI
ncbi:RrF2 family transcriptional regulator [Roseospira visakhapatnamensis]|uniref:Rrf2 family protein n=1 Tax=Roseospira visakhapatnamensis TaxID=390880 RepID=A0A7W6W8T9_9PROT|nr:Rrf2 family transcriptional regulator [Roseospira visakhapatnamensis]MBB4265204.1 Rrf2 family protein [Roseospira visakhapatnamensis]